MSKTQHGTPAGYQAHKVRWKTPICDSCRGAWAMYIAQLRHQRDYQKRADKFILLGVAQ